MKQIHEAAQALESGIGFWRPSWIKKRKKRPICVLQIFGNNPSKGFRVRAQTKCGGERLQQKQSVSTTTWVHVYTLDSESIPALKE